MGVSKKQPPSTSNYFSLPILNGHFSAVTNRYPPLTAYDFVDILNLSQPQNGQPNQFSFTPATDEQVHNGIKSSHSSSSGPDNISVSVLKFCTPAILPHITALINTSFSSAQFPTSWKNSHIHALLKSITPSSPFDTRPIALLPEMAKIQERLANDQILFLKRISSQIHARNATERDTAHRPHA